MEIATAVILEMPKPKKPRRERGTGRIFQMGSCPKCSKRKCECGDGLRIFWIQYYDAVGRQRRESSHSKIEKEAEKLLRKRIGARLNDILPPPKKSRVLVDELCKDEIAYLSNGKPKTAAWLKSRWELRLRDYFGARRAREIRLADLVAYQTGRMESYRKQFPDATAKKIAACESAVNSDLAALRMMFYRGKKLDKIDIVPTFPEKLDGALEREGTITEEQFRAMLAACRPDELWLKTFLTMAYRWGYRLRELLGLQCARLSFREGTVYLPPRSTKNKKPRPVPISDGEIPLLRECLAGKAPQDFVLTRKDGKRILDFRARWEELVEEAKAGHVEIEANGQQTWCPAIPHDLRRTAISRMLSGGMPPEAVRAIAGHISPEMTARYYKPAIETLRRLQRAAEVNLQLLAKEGEIPENRRLTNGASSGQIQDAVPVSY